MCFLLQTNTKKVGVETVESSDSDDDKNSVTVSYKSSRTGVSLTIIIALDMYYFRQKTHFIYN